MKMWLINAVDFFAIEVNVKQKGQYISVVYDWAKKMNMRVETMDLYATEQDAKNALKLKLVDSIADDRKAIEQLQEEIEYKQKKLAVLRGEV